MYMFGDTNGVIIIRISKKNRNHNGQNKKYKRTNNGFVNYKKGALDSQPQVILV
jgi:hypothetical protein